MLVAKNGLRSTLTYILSISNTFLFIHKEINEEENQKNKQVLRRTFGEIQPPPPHDQDGGEILIGSFGQRTNVEGNAEINVLIKLDENWFNNF